MLKKGFLASSSVYLSVYHEKKVLNNYLDKLNDLFKIIKKCENEEKNIMDLLSYPISKKPFERLN